MQKKVAKSLQFSKKGGVKFGMGRKSMQADNQQTQQQKMVKERFKIIDFLEAKSADNETKRREHLGGYS